ncbi:L,D-transpeptidase family protein [Phycisphaerales bacterium ac7]
MALPSQSARSRNPSYGPRFTVSRRRPRRGRARLIFAILILIGGLTAIYFWQWGGEEQPTDPVAGNTDTSREQGSSPSDADERPVSRPLSAKNIGTTPDPNNSGTRDLVMGQPTNAGNDRSTTPDPIAVPETAPKQTPPAAQPERPASDPVARPGRDAQVQSLIASGDDLMGEGRVIQARDAYNRALHHPRSAAADRAIMRTKLGDMAKEITFSRRVVAGDEMASEYTVQSGDLLSTIVRREGLDVEWMLIERINGVSANRIRVGQTLKLLRGPFHAVISKGAYRLDLYSDFRDSAGNRLYLGSFSVGLGEYDSTPVGSWVVRSNSKLIDPAWVNPRTGERFASGDPENPIGNRWIGIRGTDANTEIEEGIGLHGTIEPNSIGEQMSMGCVRMLRPDIELIYDLLVPEVSTVMIQP